MNVWGFLSVCAAVIGVIAMVGLIGHYSALPCGPMPTITVYGATELSGKPPSCTNMVVRP